MAEYPSLNDRAVAALAAVSAMDRDTRSNDPECNIIWQLKEEASRALTDAFQRAHDLSYLAETVRRDMKAAVAEASKKEDSHD